MFKRIWLFLLTNILILVVISISFTVISSVFWINLWWYYTWWSIVPLLVFAWIIWFSWAFISLFLSKFMAKQSYNIEIITQENLYNYSKKEKLVYEIVQTLSNQNGIKMPEVWIYIDNEPNAFATWATKNSSLVAVSTGLLESMDEDEISWVIAHEMAHILNWDMVTMTLMQWVINTFVVFLSRIIASFVDNYFKSDEEEQSSWPSFVYYIVSIVLEIIFSILASILVMAFSRYREYKADEGSAKFVWREKMIKALKKLQILTNRITTTDEDSLATFKIWSKKRSGIMSLFASHPDLEDRILALENAKI